MFLYIVLKVLWAGHLTVIVGTRGREFVNETNCLRFARGFAVGNARGWN